MFTGARQGIDNFFGYLVIGIFLITFTTRTLTSVTKSLETGRGLMKAFSFPRASLPLATAWREVIALLPTLYTLIILLLIVPPKATIGWPWLLFPLVVVLQTILNTGLGLVLARLGSASPDLKHLVPYATRILMYASCVMWTRPSDPQHARLGVGASVAASGLVAIARRAAAVWTPMSEMWWATESCRSRTIDRFDAFPEPVPTIARNNPFFIVLDMCRDILLHAQLPPAGHWLRLSLWAVGAFVVGIVFFWQAEVKYARRANE